MLRAERLNNMQEALLAMLTGMQSGLWTAMPAIIQSFDPVKMVCVAQPAVKCQLQAPNGTWGWVKLPLLLDVPVCFPGGGGYTLTFPVAKGDEALIVFASRCIDSWWQSGGVQVQAELRMHDLSDGFAFVGTRSQPRRFTVAGNVAQLRSDDGQTYVELGGGTIKLIADSVILHGRNRLEFDAGGTGYVYTPAQIDSYTDGVVSHNHLPTPPGPL